MRFEPIIKGENCVLSVSDFSCGLQNAPKEDDILFIENDQYKAGVSLRWSGGLSWFEDKKNTDYGNLLNNHDTGRLVQQSYYGPQKIDGYENGVYGDSVWGIGEYTEQPEYKLCNWIDYDLMYNEGVRLNDTPEEERPGQIILTIIVRHNIRV